MTDPLTSAPRLALWWPEDAAWRPDTDDRAPRCVLHRPHDAPPAAWHPELPRLLWIAAHDALPPDALGPSPLPLAALVATLAHDELDEEIELVLTTFSRRETMEP